MRHLVWIFLILVLGILVYLGSLKPYREHLLYDVSVYYQRSLYFFENSNLTGIPNEYLPVASTYFITFSPIFFYSHSLDDFEKIFVLGNCLLLLLLGFIIYREKGRLALWLFSFLLLFAGPIVLYRFEVLVILAMILAMLRFQKHDYFGSSVMLSLGLLVKLYPLLLLPYFLILTFKQKGLKVSMNYLAVFLLTAMGITLFYFFITQTSLTELVFSLDFHKDKPVGLESSMGGLHHLYQYIQTGQGAPIVARHNTWGIDDAYLLLPMPVLTYLWIFPVSFLYLWLLFSKQKSDIFIFVIAFLSSFFVFSKLFTPQYWLWILFLLPFLQLNKSKIIWLVIGFASLATAITQFIYPLHYFDFLGYFYSENKGYEYLFWIYLVEITCMITTACLALRLIIKTNKIEK
jgi:hypothetical protein